MGMTFWNISGNIFKVGRRRNTNSMRPLQLSSPTRNLHVRIGPMRQQVGEQFDVTPASKYSPHIPMQTKPKVAITHQIVDGLGKIQMTKRTMQEDSDRLSSGTSWPSKCPTSVDRPISYLTARNSNQRGNQLPNRQDATQTGHVHRRHPMVDPRTNASTTQHIFTITNSHHPIACRQVLETGYIQIRFIFPYIKWHRKGRWIAKIRDPKTKHAWARKWREMVMGDRIDKVDSMA